MSINTTAVIIHWLSPTPFDEQKSITEEAILDSIDAGLDVFGTTVKSVIYYRLKTLSNVDRKDILRKPEVFSESLRSFFGLRAFNVESAIVSSIRERFHIADLNLSDSATRAILEARKILRA